MYRNGERSIDDRPANGQAGRSRGARRRGGFSTRLLVPVILVPAILVPALAASASTPMSGRRALDASGNGASTPTSAGKGKGKPTPSPVPTASAAPTPPPTPRPTPSPAPTPSSTPSPAPTATPASTPSAPPCPASLQGAINATPTGGTLRLGACTFFESVTVDRAMTISGPAVIDGGNVRSSWMTVTASNVTVDGVTMRNAAAGGYQSGSLSVDGVSGFTLRNASLSGGSYADLRLVNGTGHTVTSSTISSARVIGILGWGLTDAVLSANRITGNNTTGADGGQEAGGVKLGQAARITITGNESDTNGGPGIWCDAACSTVTISDNRIHDNARQGILYEISSGGSITGNRVWENGFEFTAWGWGGGIVVSSSGTTSVAGNVVAWNADGIIVISQNRAGSPAVKGVTVRDNTVALAPQAVDGSDKMAIEWLQDWSGVMFDAASANTGSGDDYWVSVGEPQWAQFGWNGPISTLAAFNGTPGEEGGIYLTSAALSTTLATAGIPGTAKTR